MVSKFIFFVNLYSGNIASFYPYHYINPKSGKTAMRYNMEYSELYVKRIRQLCQKRGLTINKLATMSDVKQSTLDNIMQGVTKNPGIKTLHKIALTFNMTLAEFLDFDSLNAYSFDEDGEDDLT